MRALDNSSIAVPDQGRTVSTLTSYVANNAVFNVKDYGAVGDGSTNDTSAIQSAMTAAAGGVLYFPPGTYLISAEIVGVSNVRIVGANATIKATVTRFRSYFGFVGKSNVRFEGGLTFDLGMAALNAAGFIYSASDYAAAIYTGSIYNVAIYCESGTDLIVERCTFTNLYTNAIFLYLASGIVKISRNKFTSPVQAQKIKAEHIFSATSACHLTIDHNDFDNAAPSSADYGVPAIYCANSSDTTLSSYRVLNNRFNYCGRNSVGGHQLATVSSYGDVIHMQVHRNVMLNNLQQVIRLSCCWYVDVASNLMTMASVAGADDQMISVEGALSFSPGLVGSKDIKIHDNTFIDGTATTRIGVAVGVWDWSIPAQDVDIHHNLFVNMKYVLNCQGPYAGLKFRNNEVRGSNGGAVWVQHNAAITGTEATSAFKDLAVTDNTFDLAATGATT